MRCACRIVGIAGDDGIVGDDDVAFMPEMSLPGATIHTLAAPKAELKAPAFTAADNFFFADHSDWSKAPRSSRLTPKPASYELFAPAAEDSMIGGFGHLA